MDQNYIATVAHGVLPETLREILTFLREGAIFMTMLRHSNAHIEEGKVRKWKRTRGPDGRA